jgi:hypothetical protein
MAAPSVGPIVREAVAGFNMGSAELAWLSFSACLRFESIQRGRVYAGRSKPRPYKGIREARVMQRRRLGGPLVV